jgi:hypothetical protein
MYEVIISTVTTGRVVRRSFPDRNKADRFLSRTLDGKQLRNYRVEINYQPEASPSFEATRQPAVAA